MRNFNEVFRKFMAYDIKSKRKFMAYDIRSKRKLMAYDIKSKRKFMAYDINIKSENKNQSFVLSSLLKLQGS